MFTQIITYLDYVTIVFAFVIMILTILNFVRERKQLDRIGILFWFEGGEIVVDDNLTRKDCQRSEIQGILRTKLKKGRSFYDVAFLKERAYFENIYKIQKGKEDRLVIRLTLEELEQFDVSIRGNR